MTKKTTKTVPKTEATPHEVKATSSKKNRRVKAKSLVIIGVIVLIGVLTWQYLDAKAELRKYNDPAKAIQEESEDTVAEVGKIMVLPSGEQPVPAKIQDITKFKDNPAFANAQNGDIVLIYREQSRLIIYRPSTKQIVWTALYDATSAEETPVENQ